MHVGRWHITALVHHHAASVLQVCPGERFLHGHTAQTGTGEALLAAATNAALRSSSATGILAAAFSPGHKPHLVKLYSLRTTCSAAVPQNAAASAEKVGCVAHGGATLLLEPLGCPGKAKMQAQAKQTPGSVAMSKSPHVRPQRVKTH